MARRKKEKKNKKKRCGGAQEHRKRFVSEMAVQSRPARLLVAARRVRAACIYSRKLVKDVVYMCAHPLYIYIYIPTFSIRYSAARAAITFRFDCCWGIFHGARERERVELTSSSFFFSRTGKLYKTYYYCTRTAFINVRDVSSAQGQELCV